MIPRSLAALVAAALTTGAARGHEFWIDPIDFTVAPGAEIAADIRVGEVYEGVAYSYIPANFRRFEIAEGDALRPVEARIGDRPALAQAAGDGLQVIVHVTKDYRLDYADFAKFEAFVRHKDAEWTLAAHAARNLPDQGFGEAYSRHAKSLVAAGDGAGADRAFGLETEIVAEANPYTDDLSGGMPVRLLYRGAPRTEAQIEVFEKDADGAVAVTTVRTGADGRAVVPVQPGRRYMLDAVVLREPAPALAAELGVVWESLWANLTFEVPAR